LDSVELEQFFLYFHSHHLHADADPTLTSAQTLTARQKTLIITTSWYLRGEIKPASHHITFQFLPTRSRGCVS
jgi:hypothetical protein